MHSLPFRLSACCSDSFPRLCSLGSTIEFLVKVSARDEDNILTLVHELFTACRALGKSIVFSFCSGQKRHSVTAVPSSMLHQQRRVTQIRIGRRTRRPIRICVTRRC